MVLMPVLNTFKITTFLLQKHIRNMTEYSFYNCIRYQNAKTRQSVCSKLSVRMPFMLQIQI